MTSMHNDNKVIKVGVEAIQQDQDRQRHRLIMDWLSAVNFPAQQSDFIARRQEETGLWFLNSLEFTDWVSGTSQTLFCPGIPGAGKTMMAAVAVDHLQKTVQTADVGVAYIYCNYKRQADQTTSSLLAAMLKQLVQDRPSIAKPVSSLYDHHEVRRTRPSVEETLSALQSVLADYSRTYVVIDALDECVHDNRQELLGKLRDLQSKTGLRLMATSRFIPDIIEEFNGLPKLEVRADDADVKRFVAGQIRRLPGCVRRDETLQELVQNKIVEAVDGMFLLASLHVDSLLDKDTKKKVKSALEHLSGGTEPLKKAYDGAIQRIDVELDEEELDEDNIPDVEEIVSVCAGLVTVDEESNIIRLVHYTTQDYLKGIREKWNPSAQLDIASTCLTYLCFKTFRSGSCASDGEFESRLEQNTFLDYSARYWREHTATVQEKVSGLAMCLLQDDSLVACSVQTRSMSGYKYKSYSQDFRKQVTGLHLAASSGLVHLCEGLLSWTGKEKVIPVDSKDDRGWTPLSLAAYGGHEAVVKVLVERNDVEADSKDSNGRTPLSWAAEGGHEAVVKVLVEREDVNADSKDNDGGHEAVVKVLVKREDVDADLKDNDGWTPLSLAAYGGYEAVVKLLESRSTR
ncbi:ankyrin [Byssothecium circinans]|uniref:Ankyrin n=1 Tax=Byssothecium circinans TaxID=147558 RepID=A0A6A5UCL4_9PLEO|nr:ankyrin [Byssothecium circinans]